jgi:hypothetical protein
LFTITLSLYWWYCWLSLVLYIGGIDDYHSFFILVVLLTITRSLYWWYWWLSFFLYIGGIVDYHSFFILVVLLTITLSLSFLFIIDSSITFCLNLFQYNFMALIKNVWYIYNTCALSKHMGNMCMRLRNAGKGEASKS